MSTLFLIIALLAAGAIAYLIYIRVTDGVTPGNTEATVRTDKPVNVAVSSRQIDKTDVVLDTLMAFNINLRDNVSNTEVVTATERVIDLIKRLVEPVNTVHISGMTPVVNRMVEKYLPSLIIPFMKLSATEQVTNTPIVLEKLTRLETELTKVQEALETQNTDAFNRQAELISALFTGAEDNL